MKETPRRTKQCIGKLPRFGGKKVELRETRRAVTPFGGLVVFFEFLRQVGYCEAVRQHLPFRLTSPNAIDPVETFTAFLLSVVAGARRFAHTSLRRADVALHGLLGIARFPVDDTIGNLFKRFGQGQCQRFFSGLWNWQLERLPECSSGYSLDLDSTVFERYGSRGRCAGPIRASMDGPGIIRWWGCWPERIFYGAAGCAAATAARPVALWNFSRRRWRCCRKNMRFAWCAPMRVSWTSHGWGFWSSAGCPTSSWRG